MRTHRLSKLPDDGDPWAPNNIYCIYTDTVLHRFVMSNYLSGFRKAFSKFYRRHYELTIKDHLTEGPFGTRIIWYSVYKLKKLIGKNDISFHFRKSLYDTDA